MSVLSAEGADVTWLQHWEWGQHMNRAVLGNWDLQLQEQIFPDKCSSLGDNFGDFCIPGPALHPGGPLEWNWMTLQNKFNTNPSSWAVLLWIALVRPCRNQHCWQPGSLGVGYVSAADFGVTVENPALARITKSCLSHCDLGVYQENECKISWHGWLGGTWPTCKWCKNVKLKDSRWQWLLLCW